MDRSPDVGFDVPVIDIGAATEGRPQDVAAAVDDACRRVGFMQIRGHAIPDTVIRGLGDAMDALFGLPIEVKKTWRVPGANRGYSPPASESLSLSLGVAAASGMNDFFEAYNVGVEAVSFPGLGCRSRITAPTSGRRSRASDRRWRRTSTRRFASRARSRRSSPWRWMSSEDFFPSITDHSIDVLRNEQLRAAGGDGHARRRPHGHGGAHRLRHRDGALGRPGGGTPGPGCGPAVARRDTGGRCAAGEPR